MKFVVTGLEGGDFSAPSIDIAVQIARRIVPLPDSYVPQMTFRLEAGMGVAWSVGGKSVRINPDEMTVEQFARSIPLRMFTSICHEPGPPQAVVDDAALLREFEARKGFCPGDDFGHAKQVIQDRIERYLSIYESEPDDNFF